MVTVVALFVLEDLTQTELLYSSVIGVFGALGGATGALWQNWSQRHRTQQLAETEHYARHDALTGLVNRPTMFKELEHSIELSKRDDTVLGVLFLDLDRFKVINDSMGHDAGDELLRIVAGRLQSCVRGSDVVGRFGGDEFIVIVRDLANDSSVVAVAKQILKKFSEPVSLYGGAQVVTTSIGVAIARPDDQRRPEDLVRDADAAMYKAKQNRSGYAVFDEVQRLEVIDRLDIERDLVKGLDEDQFVVNYQPIVDTSSRRLYGFEALVRWEHPTRGLIGPGTFLGVAEETGMMGRIGELVMREACAQAAVWNHLCDDARKIRMSVNVAEAQLLDANFPALVAEVLDWSGLDASQLVLEIIEDVIVDHMDGLNMLREIRALGVSLAIDDFGTGQSSLSYVKEFDMVSTLKIDKSFVDELETGQTSIAIIEAIVAMAKALDLRVVAEGVEDPEQLRKLSSFGVDLMQGYLFNAPVAAEVIDPHSWFAERGVRDERAKQLVGPNGEDLASQARARPARRG